MTEGNIQQPPKEPSRPLRPADYDRDEFSFRADTNGQSVVVRPFDVLISTAGVDDFESRLEAAIASIGAETGLSVDLGEPNPVTGGWRLHKLQRREDQPTIDLMRLIRGLRARGILAHPNHVYFSGSTRRIRVNPNYVNPNYVNPNYVNPNYVNPNYVNPNYVNPNYVNPNYVNPNYVPSVIEWAGAGCRHIGEGTQHDVEVPTLLARPSLPPWGPALQPTLSTREPSKVQIHVIDVVAPTIPPGDGDLIGADQATLNGDGNQDGFLDPAFGHGTFVRSIIRLESGFDAKLWHAVRPLGDIDNVKLEEALDAVDTAASEVCERPYKVLNLSLGGYEDGDIPSPIVADKIRSMVDNGWLIVASAGNNGSCRPTFPASLPGVVAVGALDRQGRPARFSNFGAWVDVSAVGVDVVGIFPTPSAETKKLLLSEGPLLLGDEFEADWPDPRNSSGLVTWARWSGTSFAAPLVSARLALRLEQDAEATTEPAKVGPSIERAVDALINDPILPRLPGMGTVIT